MEYLETLMKLEDNSVGFMEDVKDIFASKIQEIPEYREIQKDIEFYGSSSLEEKSNIEVSNGMKYGYSNPNKVNKNTTVLVNNVNNKNDNFIKKDYINVFEFTSSDKPSNEFNKKVKSLSKNNKLMYIVHISPKGQDWNGKIFKYGGAFKAVLEIPESNSLEEKSKDKVIYVKD